MHQNVAVHLLLDVIEAADVMLQIAVAHPAQAAESLTVTAAGDPLEVKEVDIPGPGRVHRFRAERGHIDVAYSATISGGDPAAVVSAADAISYLRPSRYAESDRLTAMARAEFSGIDQPRTCYPPSRHGSAPNSPTCLDAAGPPTVL
jgi:hypothetical protein